MDVKTAIEKRRSIRKFKPDPLPEEAISQLLEAARLAPSGTNIQPWRFLAVTSAQMREKLSACTLDFVCTAPLVMVCCTDLTASDTRAKRVAELKEAGAFAGTELDKISLADYQQRSHRDAAANLAYLNLNVAIAIQNMILRATEIGLGTCWVFMFNRKKVQELFNLPEHIYVTALIPMGYPDQDPPCRPRLPLDEIFLGEY